MSRKVFEREVGDMLRGMYPLVIHPIDVRGTRFTFPKVADYLVCDSSGFFVLVEVKQTKTDSFPFSRIREHQREALSKVADTTSGQAFLALNFRDTRGPGQAYLIPWSQWLIFEGNWPRRSIRSEKAETIFQKFRLRRITSGWAEQGPRLI